MKKQLTLFAPLWVLSTFPVSAQEFGPGIGLEFAPSNEVTENPIVLDSGTYKATAEIVDPQGREIYVTTEKGQTIELPFRTTTKLTYNGQPVDFNALAADQKLEIRVEKAGTENWPIEVRILN